MQTLSARYVPCPSTWPGVSRGCANCWTHICTLCPQGVFLSTAGGRGRDVVGRTQTCCGVGEVGWRPAQGLGASHEGELGGLSGDNAGTEAAGAGVASARRVEAVGAGQHLRPQVPGCRVCSGLEVF